MKMEQLIFMFKNLKKFIYTNFKIFMIRFTENKNYFQGMFYTNNCKIDKTYPTNLERKSSDSITITDDFEIQDLYNTDDTILVKEFELTSE